MDNDLVWYTNKDINSSNMFMLGEINDKEKYDYYSENDNENIDNLVDLTYVNIPSIMNVLEKKYNTNRIYTFNGNIVISINPFKKIDIYDLENRLDIDTPHVYSLAEIAFRNIYQKNQSILVSGESGSGKTENTKYILKYLCNRYSENALLSDKIISSNYLIELFGNAKTIRNDNSSRFGKFIKLYIKNSKIVGGDIENYLLEKSRISIINSNEKTYHIFYLVCNNQSIVKKYGFKNIKNYKTLYNSNYSYIIDEFLDYELLIKILNSFDFSQGEIDNMFYKLKLILELLNVENKNSLIDILDNNKNLLKILDINYEDIFNKLTTKKFVISGEEITKNLEIDDIKIQVKSYSEDLYEELFNYIISKINSNLGDKSEKYLSILDIFGFEIFENNSYEQLCINYTNEVLQQIYNEYIFKNEQKEYEKENIDWTKIDFKNNDDIINLFSDKLSVFSIINEQSILGSGTNDNIFTSISKHLSGNLLSIEDGKRRDNIFKIKHYTGNVEYTIDNYIEKNRIKSKSKKIKTNLQYFVNQLNLLKNELDKNSCYFIRCIKPNDKNTPDNFNQKKVYIQLLYSGIIEGIKIVLAGYPVKKYKEDLISEFRYFNYFNETNIIDFLQNNEKDKKDYQIGINKVFLKKDFYDKYSKTNNKYRNKIIIELQKYVKRGNINKNYINILSSTCIIQNNIKRILAINKYNSIKKKNALEIINRFTRKTICNNHFINTKKSVSFLTIYFQNIFIQKKYRLSKKHLYYSNKIVFWIRRILLSRRIKERKNVKTLKNIVDEKENIITEKESLISQQQQKIEELLNIINKSKLSNNEEIDNNKPERIVNTEKDYVKIEKPKKKGVIDENYLKNDTVILTEEDNKLLEEKNLEEIGGKMHNLYLELNSKEDDINMMNHKYQVLLLAYEREKKRTSAFSFIKSLFN